MTLTSTGSVATRTALEQGISGIIQANPQNLPISGLNSLSDEKLNSLANYAALLGRWSEKINLVADTTPELLIERHILDCAAAWLVFRSVDVSRETALDIGTGAGLPGIVISILEPELKITLLEPRQKRVQFLLEAKRVLGLKSATVEGKKVEELGRGQFDVITARAVTEPGELLRLASAVWKEDGVAPLLVGPNYSLPQGREHKVHHLGYQLSDGRQRGVLVCRW